MPSAFVQAVADAWNGTRQPLWLREKCALCELAYVESTHAKLRWEEIPAPVRERLLVSVRHAVELGTASAALILQAGGR